MDEGCNDLQLQGSRGMLFRLTLDHHGYTLVAKGTIVQYRRDLKREGRMYRRLNQFQGQSIPVYLGNLDLAIPWYGFCTRIVYMMLLSYGGPELPGYPTPEQDLESKAFERALAAVGVKHGDMRFPNMLWNQELQRLVFIDFERAVRMPVVKPAPSLENKIPTRHSDASPPKRKALQDLTLSYVKLNQLALPPKSQILDTPKKHTMITTTTKMAATTSFPLKKQHLTASPVKASAVNTSRTLDQPQPLQSSDDMLVSAACFDLEDVGSNENTGAFLSLLPYADEFNGWLDLA